MYRTGAVVNWVSFGLICVEKQKVLLLVKNYQFDHREYSVSEGLLAYVQRGNGAAELQSDLILLLLVL